MSAQEKTSKDLTLEQKIEAMFRAVRDLGAIDDNMGAEDWTSSDNAIQNMTHTTLSLLEAEKKALLDALYWMYVQYCSGGHDFMNAGEDASELLENAGYIKVDGAGRITKDYSDSDNQVKDSIKRLHSEGGR